MSADYFLDTNILIYSFGNIPSKKRTAVNLIQPQATISTQVIGESIHVMSRKLSYNASQIHIITEKFMQTMMLRTIDQEIIRSAIHIMEKYGFSYYDSQILASALDANCTILYSEDLQHGQMIEGKLKIINPFL